MKRILYPAIITTTMLLGAVIFSLANPQNQPDTPKSVEAIKARMKYQDEILKLDADYFKKQNVLREQLIKELDAIRKKALEKEDLDEAQRLLEEKRRIQAELPQPGTSKGLVILCAMIGLEDKWIDVTHLVRREVKNSRLTMRPDIPNPNLALPDIAPGRHKSLMVAYTFDGRAYMSLTQDDQPVDIPSVTRN